MEQVFAEEKHKWRRDHSELQQSLGEARGEIVSLGEEVLSLERQAGLGGAEASALRKQVKSPSSGILVNTKEQTS